MYQLWLRPSSPTDSPPAPHSLPHPPHGSPSAALRLYERAVRFYSTDEQLLIEWSKLLTEDGARDATNWDKARTILQRVTGRRRPR